MRAIATSQILFSQPSAIYRYPSLNLPALCIHISRVCLVSVPKSAIMAVDVVSCRCPFLFPLLVLFLLFSSLLYVSTVPLVFSSVLFVFLSSLLFYALFFSRPFLLASLLSFLSSRPADSSLPQLRPPFTFLLAHLLCVGLTLAYQVERKEDWLRLEREQEREKLSDR